jgi:hypothetical protein
MVYFKANLTRDEILGLIKNVDIKTFCLWEGRTANQIYGAIKDSAYEMFVVACSIFAIREMVYLTRDEVSGALNINDRQIVCGNMLLIEDIK